VNLSEAKNLTTQQIGQAQGDRHTRLPDELERPAQWLKIVEQA
jgi:hypothetical protein